MNLLKFSPANTKTKQLTAVLGLRHNQKVYSLDLPAGWTCPGAKLCKSRAIVNPVTNRSRIHDGPFCQFRCFSASQEVLYPKLRKARKYNLDLLTKIKSVNKIVNLIEKSIPPNMAVCRLHVGGDFFSLNYMTAVFEVAKYHPNQLFYFYTKSLPMLDKVVQWLDSPHTDLSRGIILPNLLVSASRGGKYDFLIKKMGIREARVVYSKQEAAKQRLRIDHTDGLAATPGGSFALLLHGTMPAKQKNIQIPLAKSDK